MPSKYKHRRRRGIGALTNSELVLAFDVGTTYSGISYSILEPGQVPEVKSVTRFPAHEPTCEGSKIPTIIYYDKKGNVRAVGAEATKEGIYETADEQNWAKAEWFKLYLGSKVGDGNDVASDKMFVLPFDKTVVEVFADFLKYLLACSSSYIQDTHPNGPHLWNSMKGEIDFVLSHPNGWEGTQQVEMRKAAILANLIPDDANGRSRLSFVTEGEASLHFSVQNGLPTGVMENNDGIVIVDAGGGTIDVSSYSRNMDSEIKAFEEIAAPQCHYHGSVFVSVNAQHYLSKMLADSTFADDVGFMVKCFDKTTKLRFKNAEQPQYVKFGSTRDNDRKNNIRFGQIKLKGSDVAMFFEQSVQCIISAINEQKKTGHKPISHVFIVGGFAANDWLFNEVTKRLSNDRLNIFRPENYVNKAVSDGGIFFYLDHFVNTRVSKFHYGLFCGEIYRTDEPDHVERKSKIVTDISGGKRINNVFNVILPMNTQVSETKEFRRPLVKFCETKSDLKSHASAIWCYRGALADPTWEGEDNGNFYAKLCTIKVDLSVLPFKYIQRPSGTGTYIQVNYDIVLLFGLTELHAQIAWNEGYVEKRSPAQIIDDPEPDKNSHLRRSSFLKKILF